MNRLNLLDLATIVAVLALGAAAVWVLFYGPTEPIPMHFNWRGEPDRWGDRTEAGLLIGVMAATLAVVGGGCALYARRSEDAARSRGLIAGVIIAALWSVFESWRVWRADPDRQPF